jgi:sirohydrochlorin cobaltochelatase
MNTNGRRNECVVLFAHGSKDPRWRVPFEQILHVAQAQVGEERVRLAYMEFIEPTLQDVAQACVERGILRLKIFPLFLAMGTHLATDIPRQAEEVRARFPELTVEVLQALGEDFRVTALMQQLVLETINS